MPKFKTKSVYSAITPRLDGFRILTTRVRGRGLPKNRYDVSMASLGPSERLLHGFQERKMTWAEFSRRYRAELFDGGSADSANRTIKNHGQKFTLRLLQRVAEDRTVTLLCHCSEVEPHCHRRILEKILNRQI